MPEAYPKRQADNDLNHSPAACYGHCKIWNLSLFRVSRFGFRISAPGKASVLIRAPAAVGAATTARLGRAVLCGSGGDAGAGHSWDTRPAVNVLAGANPDCRAGLRHAMPGNVKLSDVAPTVGCGWQQPQVRVVLDAADARPDRGGALHQRVLGPRGVGAGA